MGMNRPIGSIPCYRTRASEKYHIESTNEAGSLTIQFTDKK